MALATASAVRPLIVGIVILAACSFGACSFEGQAEPAADAADPPDVDAAIEEIDASVDGAVAPVEFPIARLLEDEHILGGAAISASVVQEFLSSEGSYLAAYVDPMTGQSAAELIAMRSHRYDISPLYMLARIQTESSLVSSGSSANLDAATGCGCPDGAGCDPTLAGFGNQVECAAMKMRGYYDDLDAGRPTIAGWQVGQSHDTLDPCSVVPENKATAALFTYTPWAGAYSIECGRSDVGGSSLVALVYHRFAAARAWPGVTSGN